MKLLYYSLVMLFSWGILNASEEPVIKVPDFDPVIKNVIIGLLRGSKNDKEDTLKIMDNESMNYGTLFQAMQWATTPYSAESLKPILWDHGAFEPILWDHGYRTSKFQKTSGFSNKN